jgi:hypothetical protein
MNGGPSVLFYTYTHSGACTAVGVKSNSFDSWPYEHFLFADFDELPEGLDGEVNYIRLCC